MKKILIIILYIGVLIGLTGCENNQQESLNDTNDNELDFYISTPKLYDDIKFNNYYTNNARTVYLAGNIEEFYIKNEDREDTLKNYISNTYQTLDDSIHTITNQMTLEGTLKDGGTKIYKSQEKNITIILCNTIKGDRNIFIGDYLMEYEEFCKN